MRLENVALSLVLAWNGRVAPLGIVGCGFIDLSRFDARSNCVVPCPPNPNVRGGATVPIGKLCELVPDSPMLFLEGDSKLGRKVKRWLGIGDTVLLPQGSYEVTQMFSYSDIYMPLQPGEDLPDVVKTLQPEWLSEKVKSGLAALAYSPGITDEKYIITCTINNGRTLWKLTPKP